jgi:hypothetical protein
MTTGAQRQWARAKQVKATFVWDDSNPLIMAAGDTTKSNQALLDTLRWAWRAL